MKIWVTQGKNGPVQLPGHPETRLIDRATKEDIGAVGEKPVEVEADRFIRRRIAVGDLIQVAAPAAAAPRVPAAPAFDTTDAPTAPARAPKGKD